MAGAKGELRKETKKSSQKQREQTGETEVKQPVCVSGVIKKRSQTAGGRRAQCTELESTNVNSAEQIVFDEKERYRAVFMKLMETF